MIKERLIAELCDFGVVYSLYVRPRGKHPIIKISWDSESAGEMETHSCVFEVDLEAKRLNALGRKGNQLDAGRFCAEKICAWAARELAELS